MRGRESGKYCPAFTAQTQDCQVGVLVPASLALQDHLAASLSSKQLLAPPGPQIIPFLGQSVQEGQVHDELSLSEAERGRRGKQQLFPELGVL